MADGNLTQAHQIDIELGHVAEVTGQNASLLDSLLSTGFLPIISSIAIDPQGRLMNVNADQAATAIAALMKAELLMLSDVEGVLDQNKQLIAELKADQIAELIEKGVIRDGMKVKVEAALSAAQYLNQGVCIASWKNSEQLIDFFNGKPLGSKICP